MGVNRSRLDPFIGHRRSRRRVWVSLILGLLLVAPTTTRGAGSEGITPLEMQSYQRAFGVSATTAEERLGLQGRGAGIVELLESSEGRSYAGVWFDNSKGEFVVPLVDPNSRDRVELALVGAGLAGAFRLSESPYSWEELEAVQARVDRRLLRLIEKRLVQTSLDPRTNAVVIDVAQAVDGSQRAEIGSLGESGAVEVRQKKSELFRTSRASCDAVFKNCEAPLRGGVAIYSAAARCTAAFKAVSKTSGERFVLTAGHCVASSPGSAWHAKNESGEVIGIGTGESFSYPGHDWGAINATGSGWDTNPWPTEVVVWGGNEHTSITSESPSYFGQVACHSGSTTGSSCGTVTALDKTVIYPEGSIYHLTEVSGAEYLSEQGDSGGPVWSASTALGIHSGGVVNNPHIGFTRRSPKPPMP